MFHVPSVRPDRIMRPMTKPTVSTDSQRELTGRALLALRRRAQLSQAEAAERMGITAQAWGRYEAGERHAVLRSDLQERLARAVDADRHALETEVRRLAGDEEHSAPGVREPASRFELPVMGRVQAGSIGPQIYDAGEPSRTIDLFQLIGPNAGVLQLAGDSMLPWGEPGEIIIYDRDRYPRRGYGCVIETKEGEYYVKLYNRGKRFSGRRTVEPARDASFSFKRN